MWLKDSSIGRKFVMALSGAALVFFLLFHGCMNLALVFSEEAYNAICRFLGANWYAVIGSLGIAFLVLVHFCYGLYLTIQNRAARGNDRYAISGKKEGVTWESENMLVLGLIILGFLCLHLQLTSKHSSPSLYGAKCTASFTCSGSLYSGSTSITVWVRL